MRSSSYTYRRYAELRKPSFAPPQRVFGIAWGILYPLIFASFGYLFIRIYQGYYPVELAVPFGLNLLANALFTPIQFKLKSNEWALVDIVIVEVTLVAAIIAVWPYSPVIALVQIPYLLWGTFATILQISITMMNRGR